MALSADQLNEAMSVATEAVRSEIPDQFGKANALFAKLSKKPNLEYISGGSKIKQPVEIAENGSQGFYDGGFGVLDTSANQQLSFAEFDFKYFYHNVSFTLSDFTKTDNTANAVKSLIVAKIEGAKNAATRSLSSAMYADGTTDVNSLTGLKAITAASGTAYGGITNTDLDDSSTWLSEIDSATNTINYANLNGMVRTLIGKGQRFGNEIGSFSPDMMISNSFVQGAFLASQQSNQRFIDSDNLEAGFAGCKYNNIDWYIDEFCDGSGSGTADNHLYVLSTPSLKFCYKYGFEGKNAPMDLNTRIPNQAVQTNQSFLVGNLVCTSRRVNGVFTVLQS
tara:strand:- start:7026 stop:8036 length:1011 start_codon:yes stop_codon:yes gene_type:complete